MKYDKINLVVEGQKTGEARLRYTCWIRSVFRRRKGGL